MSHMKLFDGIAFCSVLDYLLVKYWVLKKDLLQWHVLIKL